MFFSTLKTNYRFRNYFFADLISGFGTGMSFIGASWYLLQLTGKNADVSILIIITIFVSFLISPLAGTLADRWNRKKILVFSNFIRGAIILLVAIAIFTGSIKTYYIYLLAVLGGLGWGFFGPASKAIIQEILTEEEYVRGSSLAEISMQSGMFIAAVACGYVYKYFGFGTILVIDAATFFVSNYFLGKIDYQQLSVHDKDDGFLDQIRNGAKFLLSNRNVFWFGVVMFLPFVVVMTCNVVAPGYVSQHLKADAVVFGVQDSLYGVGACLSGFIATWIASKLGRNRAISFFFLLAIVSLAYLVPSASVMVLYVCSAVLGIGIASIRIVMNSELMQIVPKEYMGRCQAVFMSVALALQIVCMYSVGKLIDAVSPKYGYLFLSIIMMMAFAGFLKLSKTIVAQVFRLNHDLATTLDS